MLAIQRIYRIYFDIPKNIGTFDKKN